MELKDIDPIIVVSLDQDDFFAIRQVSAARRSFFLSVDVEDRMSDQKLTLSYFIEFKVWYYKSVLLCCCIASSVGSF